MTPDAFKVKSRWISGAEAMLQARLRVKKLQDFAPPLIFELFRAVFDRTCEGIAIQKGKSDHFQKLDRNKLISSRNTCGLIPNHGANCSLRGQASPVLAYPRLPVKFTPPVHFRADFQLFHELQTQPASTSLICR